MDSAAGFQVHLQSLRDFAQRLEQQHELAQQPIRALDSLNEKPDLALGAFAEGFSLSDDHSDVTRKIGDLLGKVADSLQFASGVTDLVADRYEQLNAAGIQSFAALGNGAAVPAYTGTATPPGTYTAAATPPGAAFTGTATPPASSLAPAEVLARFTVPVPLEGGTVYYYDGTRAAPVRVTIQSQDT